MYCKENVKVIQKLPLCNSYICYHWLIFKGALLTKCGIYYKFSQPLYGETKQACYEEVKNYAVNPVQPTLL